MLLSLTPILFNGKFIFVWSAVTKHHTKRHVCYAAGTLLKMKSNNCVVELLTASCDLHSRPHQTNSVGAVTCPHISMCFSLGLFHQQKIIPIKTVDSEVCGSSGVTGALFPEKMCRCQASWMLFFNIMSATNKIPLYEWRQKSQKQIPQTTARKTKTICRDTASTEGEGLIWVSWPFNFSLTVQYVLICRNGYHSLLCILQCCNCLTV